MTEKGGDMTVYLRRRDLLKGFAGLFVSIFPNAFFFTGNARARKVNGNIQEGKRMKLPKPKTHGEVSLETAIKRRRTVRSFTSRPLSLEQCSQLFWAAQGITEDGGFKRAAPSGGALYPMDIYAVVGENCVKGLESGAYHYDPKGHAVSLVSEGDLRNKVAGAALSQTWMATAPLNILITAEYYRITSKYGKRGVRYAIIEAGHIGQNILLQSEAMGLGAGVVGAFNDEKVRQVVNIPLNHEPLLILPVGYKTEGL
jgi:SagB-type dehydrogenase family enzyme